MSTGMLKRDWEGRLVKLDCKMQNNGGGVFPEGTIMEVRRNYGGLNLRRMGCCVSCTGRGWSSISKVSESSVTLLPLERSKPKPVKVRKGDA